MNNNSFLRMISRLNVLKSSSRCGVQTFKVSLSLTLPLYCGKLSLRCGGNRFYSELENLRVEECLNVKVLVPVPWIDSDAAVAVQSFVICFVRWVYVRLHWVKWNFITNHSSLAQSPKLMLLFRRIIHTVLLFLYGSRKIVLFLKKGSLKILWVRPDL